METACIESPHLQNRVMDSMPVSSVISVTTNNENENVSNTGKKLPSAKSSPTKPVSSSLNPNAIPFYPLQQLQNLNTHQMNTVIDINANVGHGVLNSTPMNLNMPVFHQSPGQILVLTLPTGLPMHNMSGMQMPQMIIPLQIPVPAPTTDHNYHMNQNMLLNLNSTATSSECTTPASDFIQSDTSSVEENRYASPMIVDVLPSPEVKEISTPTCIVNNISVDQELYLPVECYVEEQVVATEDNLVSAPSEISSTPSIPVIKAVPRYKIPSPTKMNTRSKNQKAMTEKQLSVENVTKNVKVEITGSKRKAKGQKSKPQLQLDEEPKLDEKQIEKEPPDENAIIVPLVEMNIPSEIIKTTGKTKKAAKPRGKPKIKKEVLDTNVVIKQEPQILIKTEPDSAVKIESQEVNQVVIKTEPVTTVAIKKEPLGYDENDIQEVKVQVEAPTVISLVDDDDDELPELFSNGVNAKREMQSFPQPQQSVSHITNNFTSEEQRIFDQEVEHYSKPEVQCALFFPKLTHKRINVRSGTCTAEYALSGRSHCRICKETILKEELRFGINMIDYEIERVIDHWHHARCFWGTYKVTSAYSISGLGYLSEKDRKLVYECVRQLK